MIKLLKMEQGSKDWLLWREQGIGASEIGSALGVNKHQSPYELWLQKTKRKSFGGSYATERGSQMEGIAREYYEEQFNVKAEDVCVMNQNYPFLKASLDGYVKSLGVVVEIKCPMSYEKHVSAQSVETIAPEYYAQMQQQMLLTECSMAHFVSYFPEAEIPFICTPVEEDEVFQKRIVVEGESFWRYVVQDTPPPLLDSDVFLVEEDAKLSSLVEQLRAAQSQKKTIEDLITKLKGLIVKNMPYESCEIDSMSVKKSIRKGTIDYKNLPQVKDVDLEKYRKPSTVYHSFRELKKETRFE